MALSRPAAGPGMFYKIHPSLQRDYESTMRDGDEYRLRRLLEESAHRFEEEIKDGFRRIPQKPVPIKKFNPNEVASLTMALSALMDLWRVQFGDKWVDADILAGMPDKTFWSHAQIRMQTNSLFEYYEGWFRLKGEHNGQ